MAGNAAFRWADVDSVMVSCSGAGAVDDAKWRSFAQDLETKPMITRYVGGVIGLTEVTSTQRKLVVDILKNRKIHSVIVTDERLMRGMITAAAWLGADIDGCSWLEMEAAISRFDVDQVTVARVMSTMAGFKLACELNRK
jgi:hypothetical protein